MSTSSKKLSTKGQGCSSFSTNENQVLKCVKKQNKNCFFHKPSSHQIIIGTIHTLFYTGEKNEFMSHGYDLPQQKHMPPLNPRMIFSVAVENRWRRFHPVSSPLNGWIQIQTAKSWLGISTQNRLSWVVTDIPDGEHIN